MLFELKYPNGRILKDFMCINTFYRYCSENGFNYKIETIQIQVNLDTKIYLFKTDISVLFKLVKSVSNIEHVEYRMLDKRTNSIVPIPKLDEKIEWIEASL